MYDATLNQMSSPLRARTAQSADRTATGPTCMPLVVCEPMLFMNDYTFYRKGARADGIPPGSVPPRSGCYTEHTRTCATTTVSVRNTGGESELQKHPTSHSER